jgi:hypothetical protein
LPKTPARSDSWKTTKIESLRGSSDFYEKNTNHGSTKATAELSSTVSLKSKKNPSKSSSRTSSLESTKPGLRDGFGNSFTETTQENLEVFSTISEWNGHKHQPVPETDRWIYLVQYTAGAEAWDCVATDAMVLYSQNYSWKIMEQAYGRIDRLNTPFKDLWYYGFTSASMIDQAISRSLRAKETFNAAKYEGLFRGL